MKKLLAFNLLLASLLSLIYLPIGASAAFRPSGYEGKLLTRLNEGGSETTFRTTPITAPDGTAISGAKFGDFMVITINPGASNEEKISVSTVSTSSTGVATWTIIERGLSFTENEQVADNIKQHAIGETVIISNDDHFLSEQYAAIDDNETIVGQWTFSTFPITASSSFATDRAAGWVELATKAEAGSSTASGTFARLALPAANATSSCAGATATSSVVVTGASTGQINDNCITAVGTGDLYRSNELSFVFGTTTASSSIGQNSLDLVGSSLPWLQLPANTLQAGDMVSIDIPIASTNCGSGGTVSAAFRVGSSTSAATSTINCKGGPFTGSISTRFHAVSSTTAYIVQQTSIGHGTPGSALASSTFETTIATSTVDFTTVQNMIFSFVYTSAVTSMNIASGYWEVVRRR